MRQNRNVIRQSAVRRGGWKYLRRYKIRDNKEFTAALTDLDDDIAEEKNLAETNPDQLQTLSDLLDQWGLERHKTADPFVAAEGKEK